MSTTLLKLRLSDVTPRRGRNVSVVTLTVIVSMGANHEGDTLPRIWVGDANTIAPPVENYARIVTIRRLILFLIRQVTTTSQKASLCPWQ